MKNPFRENRVDVPLPHETTIGEINLRILHVSSENDVRLKYYVENRGACYPNIKMPEKVVLRPRPSDVLRRLYKGSKNVESSIVIQILTTIIYPFVALYSALLYLTNFLAYYLPLFQIFFYSHIPSDLLEEIKERTLRPQFDFHHTFFLLAVCIRDRVYFYDVSKDEYRTYSLSHSFHRSVFKISFRPVGSRSIAVGTKAGICIWDIPPLPGPDTRSAATLLWDMRCPPPKTSQPPRCVFLKHPNLTDFCWSKDGKVIVAGGVYDHRIVIWKLTKHAWIKRYRTSFHGGIHKLRFSPSGDKLMTMHTSRKFRVLSWNDLRVSRTWGIRAGTYVGNSAFCKHGNYMVFFSQDLPYVSVMKFGDITLRKGVRGKNIDRLNLKSFKVYYDKPDDDEDGDRLKLKKKSEDEETEGEDEDENFREGQFDVCGNITDLVMDDNAERMAVTFKETDVIAIFRCDFSTKHSSKNMMYPLGFIRGPPFTNENGEVLEGRRNRVKDMLFWKGFQTGALLGVFWECGKFSFYPFYYKKNF